MNIWGFSWSVDSHGNIFKDGVFVPASSYKYVPSSVINTARRKKEDKKKTVTATPSAPRESSGGKSTTSTKKTTTATYRDTGSDVKYTGSETTVGEVAKEIVTSTADFADSAVRGSVSSFGSTAILLLGAAFVLSAVGNAFKRSKR